MVQNFIYVITHADIKSTIHIYGKKIQKLNKGKNEIFSVLVSHQPNIWNFPQDTHIIQFPSKSNFKTHSLV